MRGGKREGAGRKVGSVKPAEERRDVRKLYRWSPEEYEAILRAAKAEGIKEAEFVRKAVLDRIKEIEDVGI